MYFGVALAGIRYTREPAGSDGPLRRRTLHIFGGRLPVSPVPPEMHFGSALAGIHYTKEPAGSDGTLRLRTLHIAARR